MDGLGGAIAATAAGLLEAAARQDLRLAVAESLTGGQVAASLVAVPGASRVLMGGVVAYATRIKAEVLGVDAQRLERTGPVDAVVAIQMAEGAARIMGAEVGLATTGVAGPGPADGHEAGQVHIAVVAPGASAHRELRLAGDRDRVREGAVEAVLLLAREMLDTSAGADGSAPAGEP
ncbi:CinA family protein [Actinomyces slackii]|uniref:Competence damage-inducible protein A n=1 Tax=Actinomyces slackii TaxID=52774 RepID=A0A448KD81_9ACTO|nr:CinA family protein [Actinomyces slackii]VEG74852.1 competence damage-inducible protein A [Actinomyces slackii]